MKTRLLILLFCLGASSAAFSQTQRGTNCFGGSLRIGADKSKFDNGTSSQTNVVDLRLDAGTFVIDNVAAGGALRINRSAATKGNKSRSSQTQLLGTARYYAGPAKIKVILAGQLGLAHSQSSYLLFAGSPNEERKRTSQVGGAYGLGAGAVWFLDPKVAVEGTIGWEGYALPKSNGNMAFTGLKIGLFTYLDGSGSGRKHGAGQADSLGGRLSIGISIFDGLGVPVRYYFPSGNVIDAGLYYGATRVGSGDDVELGTGLMPGCGFTFYGAPVEKADKQKTRSNGIALRLNYLTGEYSTVMTSLGWSLETVRKIHTNRSFILELGLQGQFPNYILEDGSEKNAFLPYLRCHWNIFIK